MPVCVRPCSRRSAAIARPYSRPWVCRTRSDFFRHLRVDYSSDRIEVEVDISRWPVDETTVLRELKTLSIPRLNFLQGRHLIEADLVGLGLARNYDQPIPGDGGFRDQFSLSIAQPCGQHAFWHRRIGMYNHVANGAESGCDRASAAATLEPRCGQTELAADVGDSSR